MKNKKLLVLVAAMALLLCVAVGGTLAWLTDESDKVENTFIPSKVDIELDESENLDLSMVPGSSIKKDPKITDAADSEECWVFVKLEKSNNLDTFIDYTMAANWEAVTGYDDVYRYAAVQKAGDILQVLANDAVTVKTSVTSADMAGLAADGAVQPTLTFTAYAVQSANLTTTDAAEIWKIALAKGVVSESTGN